MYVKQDKRMEGQKSFPIRNWEGYEIDILGNVYSRRNGFNQISKLRPAWVMVKPIMDKSGYLYVTLRNAPKRKSAKIHRLLADTFIPNPDKKPFVCHKDGNPLNNSLDNLYWGTAKENYDDAVRHGTHKRKHQPKTEGRELMTKWLELNKPYYKKQNMKITNSPKQDTWGECEGGRCLPGAPGTTCRKHMVKIYGKEAIEGLLQRERQEIREKIKEMGPDVVVPGLNETYIMKKRVLGELDKE